MRLKTLLFLGAAAGVAAYVKSRGGDQLQQVPPQVREAATKVGQVVPEPVKEAAATAAETIQRAIPTDAAGEQDQGHERYEPPVEAGAQPPTEPGGPPSSDATVVGRSTIASDSTDQLNEPPHPPPEGSVMPDTSDDDPIVRQQENAAAADAGSIGGNVDEIAADDPGVAEDPAMRPVQEGSGDAEESFEAHDTELGGNRQTEP